MHKSNIRKMLMLGCAVAVAAGAILPVRGTIICSGESAAARVNSSLPNSVSKSLTIYASPWGGIGETVTVSVDGTVQFSTTNQTETAWKWQPLTKGNHTLTCTFGANELTKTVNVTELDFFVQPAPNPSMAEDDKVYITPTTKIFGVNGGHNSIVVSGNSATWTAAVSDPWITLNTTTGNVGYPVAYKVDPNTNVEQRTGYVYVSGWVHTVTQDGVGGTINPENVTFEHQGGSGTIAITAENKMIWQARPNVDWLSVTPTGGADAGNVTYQVAPYNEVATRQGTLTVAGNTFTVLQYGRRMKLSSYNETCDYETNTIPITVNAFAITQWSVTPNNGWISVVDAGNGQGGDLVTIAITENPSYVARTGTVTIGTETFAVTQQGRPLPAEQTSLSFNDYEFEAAGGSCSVDVSVVANIVQWSISESLDWITVNGSTSRTGPGTVTLLAAANDTVYPRSGMVTIAGKDFAVSQKARGVELEYDSKIFDVDGGSETLSIHPEGNSAWTAVVSDPTWITIFQGDSGAGPGEITYIVAPFVGDGSSRTGWIEVGDKKVYITQRAYDLNISPNGTNVVGNAGAGEFGVSASINDVWNVIVTEPWITLVSGYDAGTGNGVVRFLYTENNTGKTRTGKIIVVGEEYTLTQLARQMVSITATTEHGGHVSGGGSYDLGSQVTLEAMPDSGYAFSYWTGATNSMQNPLTVKADVAKSYTAVFSPLPIAFTSVVSDTNGVLLTWNNLAWAGTYRIYRGITSVLSSATVLVELPNSGNCTYLDTTGDVDVEYWYWIEAEGPSDEVMSDPMMGRKEKPVISPITYTNLRGATNSNPATYQEGTLLTFTDPGTVTGYTFAGWTPSQITPDMTGAQTVRAAWTANSYFIAYNPNGGSGTMEATSATYDRESTIATNGFTWTGHVFTGWATNATGEVIYAVGQHVTNLTAQSSGVVTLYAVWDTLVVAPPQIFPANGSEFVGNACDVMILCETEGAAIYYSANGTTPRPTDAYLYTGPFTISDTATIKAIAVLDGVRSEYATATITKRVLSLGEAVSADASGAALNWTTGGDAQWTPLGDATAASGYSAQSGAIGDATGSGFSTTWLQTEVSGAGTVLFRWKVDCEWDDSGDMTWDHVTFYTNGVEAARMDGTTAWAELSFTFADKGTHTLRWAFMKDAYNEEVFSDHAWVSGFTWTPAPDPLPEISGDADVAGALAGAADTRLADHVTTATEYNAFRSWVDEKGIDHQIVKGSSRAWFSYAIGANGLLEKAFKNDDVTIDSLETESSGSFTFEVNVKDVLIGAGATAANLETVFEVQGSPSLSSNSFSRANVNVTFGISANGKLLVSATPKVECGTFFVRVRMHADEEKPRDDELTYVVVYNPGVNGSGLQQSATKRHGVALTLKCATFTRDGYTQTGWATSDGGTKAYALGASYTANAAVTVYPYWTADTRDKVQLWEGGPYWATMNIGAEDPWEYGYYFWWGDTVGYKRENDVWVASDGSSSNYSFSSENVPTDGKDISTLQNEGWVTADNVLAPEHDAAQVQWDGGWRMPTKQELDNLNNNCDWTWTLMNGVTGYIVRGRDDYAANSIFLPAAGVGTKTWFYWAGSVGYCWSSVPYSDDRVWAFQIDSSYPSTCGGSRFLGRSVRPVMSECGETNSYTVTYKPGANGSGAQQTATRPYGVALTLRGATFTRSGYTQTGWSTSDGGSKAYDLGASYTLNAAITLYPYWTADTHDKVQLWAGGPYWATTNIGAEEPWESGYYFWWGDTVGYKWENGAWVASDSSSSNFSFSSENVPTYDKDISTLQIEGWITADNVLAPEHDAAQVQWGGSWRMPTIQEFDDLLKKCEWNWSTINGVNGYVVRGREDYTYASIFLPCTGYVDGTSLRSGGYYWSSVPDSDSYYARYLSFASSGHATYRRYRYYGLSVRPVQGFTE